MNPRQNMIIANGKIITPEVVFCRLNPRTRKYDIKFKAGKVYSYGCNSVTWLKNPKVLNPSNLLIKHNKKELFRISAIYVFGDKPSQYWHICFDDGSERYYEASALEVTTSALNDEAAKNVFEYLKRTAAFVGPCAEDGTRLLFKQYEKINFVNEGDVLSCYLNPGKLRASQLGAASPVFPFGCNASQESAVKNALENQLSVIEGPPGTGKTQTILNIIANLLIAGKTVQVVSNNNSATLNVFDKLSEDGFGFLVAPLGNSENKANFIHAQTGSYPLAIQSWASDISCEKVLLQDIRKHSEELGEIFKKQERLASIRKDLQELDIELKYFEEYLNENISASCNTKIRRTLKSDRILQLWGECQGFSESKKRPSFLFRCKCRFVYGISEWRFYKKDINEVVALMQALFYRARRRELTEEICGIEKSLAACSRDKKAEDLRDKSMRYLKVKMHMRYGQKADRRVFTEEDLWRNPRVVQKEYPIALSTTFAARSSLCGKAYFDYVIVDEASQVDVTTGTLALSCAQNAVVVGDTKQLPNVVAGDDKKNLQDIFNSYAISPNYNFAEKSFLRSVCDVVPDVPKKLLREHYRCHPKIINFCNQKFYDRQLVVMSQDSGQKDAISVIKSVAGDHGRDRMNQRQIDVVMKEILPTIPYPDEEIGIIAPYNNQVDAIRAALSDRKIEVATVHKFQGREKDAIIITTVDDEVTEFSDDPYLLNVAVSRARQSLYLVVSGNGQPKDSNIGDLIDYVEYNNFKVVKSSIYSVFDFLYRHYTESRIRYLRRYRHVSEYDSENLMYALIINVLQANGYSALGVVCHQPLNMLIRDFRLLTDEECHYAMNSSTHLDFLIYNRISKKPVIAVEVDGFHYHKKGTDQQVRDIKKDHILELYGIPLLRFTTNGSGEKEKLTAKLKEVYYSKEQAGVALSSRIS
ncbi:MAG: AAA family ATPase [Candidatus Omnitrophica bacterium]|nr:AAA family ATPase [Candidatus Omnitrophota bacterium]